MLKTIKNTFVLINKNLWLLFLFMTICYLGIVYFSILKASANSIAALLFGFLTLLLIAVAGIAGFFGTLRSTVEKVENPIKCFTKSVGEYFLSSVGILFIYSIISFLIFITVVVTGTKIIGMFSFSLDDLAKAFESVEALTAFQNNISEADLLKLSQWHLLYIAITSIVTFLFIHWIPEVFFKTKNPFVALYEALKKMFYNALKTFQLFLTVVVFNMIFSIIVAFLLLVPQLEIFVYFIYFYGLLFIVTLIFEFYNENFVSQPIMNAVEKVELDEGGEEQ